MVGECPVPGYAIDGYGKRFKFSFGENTIYDGRLPSQSYIGKPTGGDMMWNPPRRQPFKPVLHLCLIIIWGQRFIYGAHAEYDGCKTLRDRFGGWSILEKIPDYDDNLERTDDYFQSTITVV